MMVHMRPRVSRGLPSTTSCDPRFSRCTCWSRRNCSPLSTFSRQWIRILPRVGLGCKRFPTFALYCCMVQSLNTTASPQIKPYFNMHIYCISSANSPFTPLPIFPISNQGHFIKSISKMRRPNHLANNSFTLMLSLRKEYEQKKCIQSGKFNFRIAIFPEIFHSQNHWLPYHFPLEFTSIIESICYEFLDSFVKFIRKKNFSRIFISYVKDILFQGLM